jgi:hemerythrin-like metal-binding protein
MITLSKSMEVGIPLVDEQHKELVDKLNHVTSMGVESASKEETQKTLDFLGDYIHKHFSDEEALQKQSNYPKYEWHKQQHKLYIDNFAKLKQEFAMNGASLKFTLDLNNSIVTWIVSHIKSVDVEFGKFYQEIKK